MEEPGEDMLRSLEAMYKWEKARKTNEKYKLWLNSNEKKSLTLTKEDV